MNERKINCWEFQKCGREPGGKNIDKYGVCFVPVSIEYNGINDAKNEGRFCWSLRESACENIMRKCRVNEIKECRRCTFYIFIQESDPLFSEDCSERDEYLSKDNQQGTALCI